MKKSILSALLFTLFLSTSQFAQPAKILNSSELKLALKKLNVLGSVLYVAAHPDDDNTSMLSYFSSGRHLRAGYLAMTRGDGGQNRIGNEQDEMLGVIRTQELITSRKTDGAEQFFTRAIDFGYTKSPDETLAFWGKEEILSDVVWVIRKFRPDVIVTRFPDDGRGGHGQHTASAILANEAFNLAGDSTKFPEQLKYVKTWQPKRLYWNGWGSFLQNQDGVIKINAGDYNPLLGESYSEIGAESRSKNKSQGVGGIGRRGENINYFQLIKGDPAQSDLFDGIDLSWNRVEGTDKINALLSEAEKNYTPENPLAILPLLVKAYNEIEKRDDSYWITVKKKELLNVIRSAAGLWIEALADNYSYSRGNEIKINTGIVNRSDYPLKLERINISYLKSDDMINQNLLKGDFISHDYSFNLPGDINITQPYWLKNQKEKFRYSVDDQRLIGKVENDPVLTAEFILSSKDGNITLSTPVLYRWNDPVEGEKYRPIEIIPEVTISLQDKIYLFLSNNAREIVLTVRNNSNSFNGKVRLNLPGSWSVIPTEIPISIDGRGQEKQVSFVITPPKQSEETEFTVEVTSGNEIYNKEMVTISYPHITTQTLFPLASGKLLRLNTEKVISSVGYIEGSGDDIPKYLEQLGYNIEELSDDQIENGLLKYDAIITGIRAYNTRDRLQALNKNLLDYVYNGGTLIVQYNTNRGLVTDEIGPYPFSLSRNRVTDEESAVTFLKPEHEILNRPNKITRKDFEGWVQERGLYFPDVMDPRYETILAMNDKGEGSLSEGLIFTNYGKGVFIYTSLSFFRQLPAGVPGAYRFFINLISAGNQSG